MSRCSTTSTNFVGKVRGRSSKATASTFALRSSLRVPWPRRAEKQLPQLYETNAKARQVSLRTGDGICCIQIGDSMKLWLTITLCGIAAAQETHQHATPSAPIPLQPMAQQVRQLEEAMNYLGQPFGTADLRKIHEAVANPDEAAAVRALESILDAHALLIVDINPESRVKVEEGPAKPELVEAGARLFLVKVINNGHVRAPLVVQSPNSGDVYIRSNGNPAPAIQLSPQESKERWANISLYQRPPMRARLSGLALEYAILEVYSRDAGQRSAKISFNVGQGSQDIGFRNDVTVLFST